jgi:hypothetical protein
MWVRSEYANELAVLSAWLSVLIPWNITRHKRTDQLTFLDGLVVASPQSRITFLRFPFFEIQLRKPGQVDPDQAGGNASVNGSGAQRLENADASGVLNADYAGTELFGDVFVTTPPSSVTFYEGTLQQASLLWLVASLAFGLAFVLSLTLYVREEQTAARLPTSPVRLMGILLAVGALGTAGATVLQYMQRGLVGFPIPAGVIVVSILAAVLLQTEEVDSPTESAQPDE